MSDKQIARVDAAVAADPIRTWMRRQQVDVGDRPGATTGAAVEIERLKQENAESRRANEILKAASAVFAGELDRPHLR